MKSLVLVLVTTVAAAAPVKTKALLPEASVEDAPALMELVSSLKSEQLPSASCAPRIDIYGADLAKRSAVFVLYYQANDPLCEGDSATFAASVVEGNVVKTEVCCVEGNAAVGNQKAFDALLKPYAKRARVLRLERDAAQGLKATRTSPKKR